MSVSLSDSAVCFLLRSDRCQHRGLHAADTLFDREAAGCFEGVIDAAEVLLEIECFREAFGHFGQTFGADDAAAGGVVID